ncbi:hypothetical protein CB1_000138038 [Camelus ferus]|nr:hypothetical protein CB1_000138038 [Camelus ferus]
MEPRDGSPEARSSDSESASASSSGFEPDTGPEPDKTPRRLSKRRFPGLRLFGHRKAITRSGLQHLAPPPPAPGAPCSEPERQIPSTVDWSESATYGEHIWFETNVSGDFCYVGGQYCVAKMLKSVSWRKCAVCKIVVHTPCFEQLEKIMAISCSWCKQVYHSKVSCFMLQQIEEPCSLGVHAAVVTPPIWILYARRPQNTLKASKKKKTASFKRF